MIQVFLADDNRWVREALLKCINWKENGFEIIGQADNGIEALQIIEIERPELLILDIKMPGLTGLEVLKEVRKKEIPCECILVTGYDEFSFAQQAIRYGVSDFILKPVDDKELLSALRHAAQKLNQKKEEHDLRTGWRMQETNEKIYQKMFLDGMFGDEEAAIQLEKNLREEIRFSCCELLLICKNPGFIEEWDDTVAEFVSTEQRVLQECRKGSNWRYLTAWTPKGLAVLLLFQEIRFGKDYELDALRIANELIQANKKRRIRCGIGISEKAKELKELSKLYEHAFAAWNSRFIFENKDIIHYATMQSKGIKNGYDIRLELNEFYRLLKEKPAETENCIRKIGMILEESESCDVDYIKSILVHMGLMMNGFSQQKGKEVGANAIQEIVRNIGESRSIREAINGLIWYALQINRLRKQQEEERFSPLVVKILNYMKRNYASKISQQEVADYMGISVSHLCRILKKDTGETFTSLMNKIRIQEAIRMLRSGEYRIYEIAEKVGFGNYAYFYQLFKKETGCSPTEYTEITE